MPEASVSPESFSLRSFYDTWYKKTALIATGVTVSTLALAGLVSQSDATAEYRQIPALFKSCPDLSPTAADSILDTPTAKPIADFITQPGNPSSVALDQQLFDITDNAARANGLEVVSPMKAKADIRSAKDAQTVLDAADTYSRQLGIHTESTDSGVHSIPFLRSFKSLDTKVTGQRLEYLKANTNDYIGVLSILPKEFIQAIGLKHVVFVSDLEVVGYNGVAGYEMPESPDTILLNMQPSADYAPSGSYAFYLTAHEIGHKFLQRLCGVGAIKDKPLSKLNGPQNKYKGFGATQKKILTSGESEAPQHGYVDTYSQSSAYEDGAVNLSYVLSSFQPDIVYSDDPVVRSKSRLQIVRLDYMVHGMAAYLKAISVAGDYKKFN